MTEGPVPDAAQILSLVEERAIVSTTAVETGRVRVSTHAEERQVQIRETLCHEDVVVQRVAFNRVVESAPPPRQEGDTLIVSVVEEVLVVEKRLVLKEEVHLIRTSRLEPFEQDVTLRAMHAHVQRTTTPIPPK